MYVLFQPIQRSEKETIKELESYKLKVRITSGDFKQKRPLLKIVDLKNWISGIV